MMAASKTQTDATCAGLQQDQEFRILLVPESSNGMRVFSKHRFDVCGRAVTVSNPHNTGNGAGESTALLEVRILGHDGESVLQRKTPDSVISGAVKPSRLDVQ